MSMDSQSLLWECSSTWFRFFLHAQTSLAFDQLNVCSHKPHGFSLQVSDLWSHLPVIAVNHKSSGYLPLLS
ncbi:hypothetical protein I79_009878 [Cricetulus griseus]|uniref:Uncharacterized protein n=1 Tax=Cricetulus griseus TaxID=10029 RepID=G3HGY4_CRIGR|nr:hypothetical protein I79_009878 [Cricetulus griseus]